MRLNNAIAQTNNKTKFFDKFRDKYLIDIGAMTKILSSTTSLTQASLPEGPW